MRGPLIELLEVAGLLLVFVVVLALLYVKPKCPRCGRRTVLKDSFDRWCHACSWVEPRE